MKKSTIVTIILIAAAVVLGVIFISWYLRKATPLYIQGTVECTTYKASSKVPGRIEEMKVEEGQHVTKGELLYTLSTPELNAKLQQAEAVKSAASAMDQKALTGARIQQKTEGSRTESLGKSPGRTVVGPENLRPREQPL